MKISRVAVVFLSGLALGALTGVLMAPDEGSKTRKKWLKKAKKYKKNVEDTADEYKNKFSDLKENVAGAVHDVKKRFS